PGGPGVVPRAGRASSAGSRAGRLKDRHLTGPAPPPARRARLPQLAGVPVRRAGLLDGHAGRATVTADCGRARCRQGELRVPAGRGPRARAGPARRGGGGPGPRPGPWVGGRGAGGAAARFWPAATRDLGAGGGGAEAPRPATRGALAGFSPPPGVLGGTPACAPATMLVSCQSALPVAI